MRGFTALLCEFFFFFKKKDNRDKCLSHFTQSDTKTPIEPLEDNEKDVAKFEARNSSYRELVNITATTISVTVLH